MTLEDDTIGGPARKAQATILGLAPNGYLLATDTSGQQFELHPDGNRCAADTFHEQAQDICCVSMSVMTPSDSPETGQDVQQCHVAQQAFIAYYGQHCLGGCASTTRLVLTAVMVSS